MNTPAKTQSTAFSRDIAGRYLCNGLDEALHTIDRNIRADARPFDIIVVGGGTFGAAIAANLYGRDKLRQHRILVLEGGPVALLEHVQNVPMPGLDVPTPTSIAALRQQGLDRDPRNEVWGLAWHSGTPFTGLAYCLGGRSVYWGGWSPQLLDEEMPAGRWPAGVVSELNAQYFREASEQIGVNVTNDFISGALHSTLRQRLFDGLQAGDATAAVPLAELPLYLDGVPTGQEDLHKVEAPLAVQTQARPGTFPLNKFSALPLLTKAARAAATESNFDDFKKRLMVVPNCHARRLVTAPSSGGKLRVTAVETSLGTVPVAPNGVVIIALGTIESTRLALESFGEGGQTGRNLMAHLRSNLVIRIPRTSLGIDPAIKELQASALFVKGRHSHGDGSVGHFHLQITAAGLDKPSGDSEAELFKKIPDIDTLVALKQADDQFVVITLRGIGEMEPDNAQSFVRLDPEPDEFGLRRAFVEIAPSAKDLALWATMDQMADDVAQIFAGAGPIEILTPAAKRRDGLGTTHHETGTLRMGDDALASVTNGDGRFHAVRNAYVTGPALFPTIGSPNPMLTGIALARRLARKLVPDVVPFAAEPGFTPLFDGLSLNGWRMAGLGDFAVLDGALESSNDTNDLGLLWNENPTPADFLLKLEWRATEDNDNSGVFLRFPDPNSKGYVNPAWVGVHFGYEAQIDESGAPDGAPEHKTGAIYAVSAQVRHVVPAKPVGEWNSYEIAVQGQKYEVRLNGAVVTEFENGHAGRGLPSTPGAPAFIGLQSYPGKRVAFRNVQIKAL